MTKNSFYHLKENYHGRLVTSKTSKLNNSYGKRLSFILFFTHTHTFLSSSQKCSFLAPKKDFKAHNLPVWYSDSTFLDRWFCLWSGDAFCFSFFRNHFMSAQQVRWASRRLPLVKLGSLATTSSLWGQKASFYMVSKVKHA